MKMKTVVFWGVALMSFGFVWLYSLNELKMVTLWPVAAFVLGEYLVLFILTGGISRVPPKVLGGMPFVGTIEEHFVYTHKRISHFSSNLIVFVDESKVMIDKDKVRVTNVSGDWPIIVLNHKGKQVYPEQ